jgi:hypothetical protein
VIECVVGSSGSGQCEVARLSLSIIITSAAEAARIILPAVTSNPNALELLLAAYSGMLERDSTFSHQGAAALAHRVSDGHNTVALPGASITGVRPFLLLRVGPPRDKPLQAQVLESRSISIEAAMYARPTPRVVICAGVASSLPPSTPHP